MPSWASSLLMGGLGWLLMATISFVVLWCARSREPYDQSELDDVRDVVQPVQDEGRYNEILAAMRDPP